MQQVPVGCAGLTSTFWPAATCCLCSVIVFMEKLQHGQIRLNLETHTQSFFNHFREHYINLPSFPGDQIVSTTYPSPRFTSPGTSFSPQMELYCTQHISNTTTHTGSKFVRQGEQTRKKTSETINGSRAQWRLSHWAEIFPAPCMTGVLLQILSMCNTMVQANTHTLTATH